MIRQARVEDSNAIAEVHVASWRSTYKGHVPDDFLAGLSVPQREARWRESLETGESSVFIATESGVVVGFVSCGASRDKDVPSQTTGEVYSIYLRAEYQRCGLGRALWNTALSTAREKGFQKVTLWVPDSNSSARRFYESMGCALDGATKIANIGGKEVLELRYSTTLP